MFVTFFHPFATRRNCKQNKTISCNAGYLTRMELQTTIEELTYQEFDLSHIEVLYTEFDNDGNGKIDFPEFKTMISYLGDHQKNEHAVRKTQ